VRRQSEHFDDYRAALEALEARRLTFPSFESRAEIAHMVGDRDVRERWPRDPDGVPIYPGRARKLSAAERRRRRDAGEPFTLRLAMDKAVARAGVLNWTETGSGPKGETGVITAAPQMWGDVILARKETPASYHLAAVVDDALQGVTDVVRGEDLFMATGLHRLLQILLDLPPPDYHHHELLRDAAGRKLSKSLRAKSLRTLRQEGLAPAKLKAQLGLNKRSFAFVP
jgi:glutamyl-Q tRNA(Asp) synthetase